MKQLAMAFMLILMSFVVIAEEENMRPIQVYGDVWDLDNIQVNPAFSFVPALSSGYTVVNKFISSSTSDVSNFYGSQCALGDYITLLFCSDSAAKNCVRVFSNDYKKENAVDKLDITAFRTQSWFITAQQGKYVAYECRRPGTTGTGTTPPPTNTVSDPTKFGQVLSVAYPKIVEAGQTLKVTGRYKTFVDGPFVLEATIDQTSRTTLAVITATSSSCDSSKFVAGRKVNGIAGQVYDYELTFVAPITPGKYDLTVYSFTDCVKYGGKFITEWRDRQNVEVKQFTQCNMGSTITNLFKQRLAIPQWYQAPSSTIGSCDVAKLIAYCGTTDSDNDKVPDNCDYCPADFGAMDAGAVGCHPCFGKAPTDSCWATYEKTYGIPAVIQQERNPVVGYQKKCDGDKLVQCQQYKDGTLGTCSTVAICLDGCSNAACLPPKEVPPTQEQPTTVTSLGTVPKCDGMDLWLVSLMSDGTSKPLQKAQTCQYGCEDDSCNPAPRDQTCDGGLDNCNSPPVITCEDCEEYCTVDANCPALQKCDSQTGQCVDYVPVIDGCTSDAECDAGEVCSIEIGVCVSSGSVECSKDADCEAPAGLSMYCYGGFCFQNGTTVIPVNESGPPPCTQNEVQKCESGSVVITAMCKDNKLFRLDNSCPETGGDSKPVIPGTTPSKGGSNTTWFIIGGAALIGGIIYMMNAKPKGKRRRR